MKEAGIAEAEWPARLGLLLTGKSLTSYSRDVPEESKNDYYKLKEALLEAMGLSQGRCRSDLWTFTKKSTESWQETARTLEFMIGRCLEGCESLKDLQKPATPVETANCIEEHIQSQVRNRQYRQSRPWHRNSDRSGGREWSSEKGRQTGENRHGNGEYSRTLGFRGSENQPNRQNKDYHRYITCFTCGKKGHKSVDCPEKKENRIIVKPSVLPPTLISGKVGKMGLDITLDTGADISTVHSKFVQPFEYLGRHISVLTVGGTKLSMPLA